LTRGLIGRAGIAGRVALLAVVAGLLAGALVVPAVGAVGLVTRNTANKFNNMKTGVIHQLPVRSEILDSKGRLLAYFYPKGIDREPVSFNQISPIMRKAIVAIEDSRFYQHGAIDIRGTIRAMVNDLEGRQVQGGSTLTQQYVKNALILTAPNSQQAQSASAHTLTRKIKELRLAIHVEKTLSKDQIVAGYLNAAFFGTSYGNQAVGVGAAAERYFDTTAAKLTLPQAALLAGMVENPVRYDPVAHPGYAISRRNIVLTRMAQLRVITRAAAAAAEKKPLRLHLSQLQTGCTSGSARSAAFFCDYVVSLMKQDNAFSQAWNILNSSGGLKVYTTLNRQDEHAAKRAVNYMVPQPPNGANPGGNAASEVLMQPGTGRILAIANDRSYGIGKNQTTVNYAVNTPYDGGVGVQTGSSSKLFTLLTALEQNVPFGFPQKVPAATTLTGYTNCKGQPTGPYPVINDSPSEKGAFTLYTATTQSVNIYYAMLERMVGLCNVVKMAASLGVTRADGKSLLKWDGKVPPADNIPAFTLGAVNVSPMSMAEAYATVAARGVSCTPIAVAKIVSSTGAKLPVEKPHCHQAISAGIADAASYVLQGVLTSGTAAALGGIGRPAAGKTGTSDSFDYAAFGGYTPDLAGYVSVFNPADPVKFPMQGAGACYRLGCDGAGMFGADAPGHTWQMTFEHAVLANPAPGFMTSDIPGALWIKGDGQTNPSPPKKPKPKPKPGNGGGGNGNGNGNGPGGGGGGRPPTP
jgi:membrane peptidoglycan carboxypeptidase